MRFSLRTTTDSSSISSLDFVYEDDPQVSVGDGPRHGSMDASSGFWGGDKVVSHCFARLPQRLQSHSHPLPPAAFALPASWEASNTAEGPAA
jgi:hypothetical protein